MTALPEPFVIRSAGDLAALRPGRPPRRIALRVPQKPPLEMDMREERLVRVLGDCGCSTGGTFVLAGLACSPFLFLTGVMDGLSAWAVAGRLVLFLAAFALAGSAIGRWRVRRAQRRELAALARWIEAG